MKSYLIMLFMYSFMVFQLRADCKQIKEVDSTSTCFFSDCHDFYKGPTQCKFAQCKCAPGYCAERLSTDQLPMRAKCVKKQTQQNNSNEQQNNSDVEKKTPAEIAKEKVAEEKRKMTEQEKIRILSNIKKFYDMKEHFKANMDDYTIFNDQGNDTFNFWKKMDDLGVPTIYKVNDNIHSFEWEKSKSTIEAKIIFESSSNDKVSAYHIVWRDYYQEDYFYEFRNERKY